MDAACRRGGVCRPFGPGGAGKSRIEAGQTSWAFSIFNFQVYHPVKQAMLARADA
jgi:hypothetical protein